MSKAHVGHSCLFIVDKPKYLNVGPFQIALSHLLCPSPVEEEQKRMSFGNGLLVFKPRFNRIRVATPFFRPFCHFLIG